MSVKYPIEKRVKINTPQWSKNASIYQVNTRQYSANGDFNSVIKDLERIKHLGCDIVWLMPIHEIGHKNNPIEWRHHKIGDFYQQLLHLKKSMVCTVSTRG